MFPQTDIGHEPLLHNKHTDAIVSYFALTWVYTFGRHGV